MTRRDWNPLYAPTWTTPDGAHFRTGTSRDALQVARDIHRTGEQGEAWDIWVVDERVRALRQIMVQNYYRDGAGRLRWRTAEDGGLPPSAVAVVSPYDPTARYARRGHVTRWKRVRRTSHRDL
ncbi:hypothetical protein [Streptomyces sp. NPDC001970]